MPAIKIQKNSIKRSSASPSTRTRPRSTQGQRTSASGRPTNRRQQPQPNSGAWIKWAVMGGFALILIITGVVYASASRRSRRQQAWRSTDRHESHRTRTTHSGRNTSLDGVDLRAWSQKHDKDNKLLQERRERMRKPVRR